MALMIIAMPDGVSIVPKGAVRKLIRRGPILCIDTGAGRAEEDAFDVDRYRDERLDSGAP